MFIQNTGNMAHAPQPVMHGSDGAPNVVVARSNVEVQQPGVSLELPQVAAKPAAEPSAAQLQNAVDNINKALKQENRNLEFSVDEITKKTVFQLKDTETGDVIRQYPTEEMLAISRSIDQIQQGLLLKQKA